MFKSKRRPIVFPQAEHLRLVGALAMLWGNTDFDTPPVERTSMIAGMGLHDRGYGLLDDHPIGGMQDDEWDVIARHGFYMQYSDLVADTIAKYHFRRLASYDDSPGHKTMTDEFSRAIRAQLEEHHLSQDIFDRLDRITNLCDKISFDFCFDVPASGEVAVYPRNAEKEQVTVHYRVEAGTIQADPWPFAVDSYQGYVFAYHLDGYPERLDPLVVPFSLQR